MFFLLLGFIGLWAITEIVESFLTEKRNRSQIKHLRWLE